MGKYPKKSNIKVNVESSWYIYTHTLGIYRTALTIIYPMNIISNIPTAITFIMPPFEEEAVYCFANVGRSVGRSVGQ